jgi:hypothetical protein
MDERTDNPPTERLFVVAWFLVDCYLPRQLRFRATAPGAEVTILPIELPDPTFGMLVEEFLRRRNMPTAGVTGSSRYAAVLIFEIMGSDWEEAFLRTEAVAQRLMTTLAYRQRGLGRVIGHTVLDPMTGTIMQKPITEDFSRVMWLPFSPEEEEVLFQLGRIHSTSQGPVLARLYGEACREPNPTVAVVRFWALLESLGEQLGGSKFDHALRVLKYARQPDPPVAGKTLTRTAYDIRNGFMHQGQYAQTDLAKQVRDELQRLLEVLLFQVGWQPLSRTAPRQRPQG